MYDDLEGYINLSGVRSTGLTLSVAMGKYVVQQMQYHGAGLEFKKHFVEKRKGIDQIQRVLPGGSRRPRFRENPSTATSSASVRLSLRRKFYRLFTVPWAPGA